MSAPALARETSGGIAFWTDPELAVTQSVRICFTERGGGVSRSPYAGLNLAAHVGDDPDHVDTNRQALLDRLGLAAFAPHLTTADQVHGDVLLDVDSTSAGAGALAGQSPGPVAGTDALMTSMVGVPLLLCFADCVPVVLVAPGPVVAVVHAGWRGALAGLPGSSARAVARAAGCQPSRVRAYIGAHIGPCHYQVSDEILSQFTYAFGTVARAESGGLDLGTVVNASLSVAGVDPCNIARLGACTAEATDRFFSYRAEGGLTGRHGALVCILPR